MRKLNSSSRIHTYQIYLLGLVLLILFGFVKFSRARHREGFHFQNSSLIPSSKEVSTLLTKEDDEYFYFAYASDLLESRIHVGGGPSAKFVAIGKVLGRKFVYSQESKVWKGGVADIVPESENSAVWGVLYRLKKSDEATMDKQKGINKADPLYEKIKINVLVNGQSTPTIATTYAIVSSKRVKTGVAPSIQYRDCLIRGAIQQGLPNEYIDFLRKIPDNGSTYKRKNVC